MIVECCRTSNYLCTRHVSQFSPSPPYVSYPRSLAHRLSSIEHISRVLAHFPTSSISPIKLKITRLKSSVSIFSTPPDPHPYPDPATPNTTLTRRSKRDTQIHITPQRIPRSPDGDTLLRRVVRVYSDCRSNSSPISSASTSTCRGRGRGDRSNATSSDARTTYRRSEAGDCGG